MKRTVLDYTQNILSALGSDEVNSIGDTTESLQVAEIVKTTFFNMASRANLPDQTKPYQLDPSLSLTEPNLMFIPDGAKSLEWVKYFDSTVDANNYKYVTILPMQQFADYVNGYSVTDINVDTLTLSIDGEVFRFNYKNDTQPRFCTVIRNFYVVFDSFNNTLDDTLQASKTMCYGLASPIWQMEDNFIPELDDQQVALLLNEAKSLAFFELKQLPHTKAEQEARRQWSSLQKDKSVDNKPSYFDQLPNFGRKPVQSRSPNFKW
jgi:hypothetical protein